MITLENTFGTTYVLGTMFDPGIDRFQRWLERKHDTESVGVTGGCAVCPIAQYLMEYGYQYVSVTGQSVMFSKQAYNADYRMYPYQYDLARWMREFISTIDAIGFDKPVMAYQALNVIRNIRRRWEGQ